MIKNVLATILILNSCGWESHESNSGTTNGSYGVYYRKAKEIIKLADKRNPTKLLRVYNFNGIKNEVDIVNDLVWIDSTFRKDTLDKVSYEIEVNSTPSLGDTVKHVIVSFSQYNAGFRFYDKLQIVFPLGYPDIRNAEIITIKASDLRGIQQELELLRPPIKN